MACLIYVNPTRDVLYKNFFVWPSKQIDKLLCHPRSIAPVTYEEAVNFSKHFKNHWIYSLFVGLCHFYFSII